MILASDTYAAVLHWLRTKINRTWPMEASGDQQMILVLLQLLFFKGHQNM